MIAPSELNGLTGGESSATVALRVQAAHQLALQRQGCSNARLSVKDLDQHASLEPSALQLLEQAASRLGWSARSYHRVLRVARTIADLASHADIGQAHMAEAVQLRRGLPGV